MLRSLLTLTLWLAVAQARTAAQAAGIEIEARLDESSFLPGEDIAVAVRVANLSGQPITFGTSPDWLTFFVESQDGDIIARLGSVPVLGEFTLQSAQAGTKWWNIQPHFDLDRPGSYLVYAELRLPDWDQRLISDPASFNVQPARKLWEVSFGVPPTPGQVGEQPEIRRYSLQSATRNDERKLFARVTDESETRIYKVVMLDRLLSFAQPRHQLDHLSRLHVLLQTAGSRYSYFVVTPDGALAVRQWHDIVPGSRPHLAKLEDGSIEVRGGVRHPTPSDIPLEEPRATLTPPAPEPNTVTNASPASSTSWWKSLFRRRR